MFLSTKNNDTTNISFSEPENNEDILFCEILNGSEPLYIQTPKMMFKEEENNKLQILFQNLKDTESLNPFYEFFKNVEQTICSKISESSKNWFSQEISQQSIQQNLYKTAITLPEKLNFPLGIKINLPYNNKGEEDFEIYNRSQKRLDFDYLIKNNNTECTFLLLAKELVISSTQAHVEWELVQALVHKKKKKITGFGIRKDKTENVSLIVNNKKSVDEKSVDEKPVDENLVDEKPVEKTKVQLLN